MTIKKPIVQITKLLSDKFTADNKDVDAFLENFRAWKATGLAGEYGSQHFGKDAFYDRPKVDGVLVLRHVHMRPTKDLEAQSKWDKLYRRRGKKTSNVALIYAEDPTHGFLLIDLLEEPVAHAVAEMKTAEHRAYMETMADVADAFIFSGVIAN